MWRVRDRRDIRGHSKALSLRALQRSACIAEDIETNQIIGNYQQFIPSTRTVVPAVEPTGQRSKMYLFIRAACSLSRTLHPRHSVPHSRNTTLDHESTSTRRTHAASNCNGRGLDGWSGCVQLRDSRGACAVTSSGSGGRARTASRLLTCSPARCSPAPLLRNLHGSFLRKATVPRSDKSKIGRSHAAPRTSN